MVPLRKSAIVMATLVLVLGACNDGDSGGDGGGDTGSPVDLVTCTDCAPTAAWNCSCIDPFTPTELIFQFGQCKTTPDKAICLSQCQTLWANLGATCPSANEDVCYTMPGEACADYGDSGSCSGWSPASHISIVSGVRHMSASWFAGIVANPAPLWTCDDAYLQPRSSTGFTVNGANSGELLYAFGLRNGDIPLTLNGMELDNYWEAINAYWVLYRHGGATTYDLAVKRGTSTVHLLYQLDSP